MPQRDIFLRELNFNFNFLKKLKEKAAEQLSLISRDEANYSKLITNLIAQSLYRLIEPEIFVKCREKDLALVNVKKNLSNLKGKQLFKMCFL